jgi:hypothetical protein
MSGSAPKPDLRGCRLGIEIAIGIGVGQFDFDSDVDNHWGSVQLKNEFAPISSVCDRVDLWPIIFAGAFYAHGIPKLHAIAQNPIMTRDL